MIFDLVGIIFFLTDRSNFLLLFTQGYGEVSISKHRVLFAQFLCTQYTELAGCESEPGFLFFSELFSSVYFSFLMFGVQGEDSPTVCNIIKLRKSKIVTGNKDPVTIFMNIM